MWNIEIREMKYVTWGYVHLGLGKAVLEHQQLSHDPGDRGSQLSEHEEERAPTTGREEAVWGRGRGKRGGGRGKSQRSQQGQVGLQLCEMRQRV